MSKSDLIDSMRTWYNGYAFSEHYLDRVYNPYSVLAFLAEKKFKNHWFETGTPTFLINLIKERNFPMIELEKSVLTSGDLGSFDVDQINLPILLFQTGYLTIKSYDSESKTFSLSYPNKEIYESIIEHVVPLLIKRSSFSSWELLSVKLKKYLVSEDLQNFTELLKIFFADIPYTIHIGLEKYYQTIFYMLMKFMGAEILMEEATNVGRIDAVLQTPTHMYIIEFKMGRSAQEAIKQIQDRQYAQKYQDSGKVIVLLGIAFDAEAKNIVDVAWDPHSC